MYYAHLLLNSAKDIVTVVQMVCCVEYIVHSTLVYAEHLIKQLCMHDSNPMLIPLHIIEIL